MSILDGGRDKAVVAEGTAELVDNLQQFRLVKVEDQKKSCHGPFNQIIPEGTPQNPTPDTWKHDSAGHLLQAGDQFSASYDAAGNPTKIKMGDDTYEWSGPHQVKRTFRDNEGKVQSKTIDGVSSMSVSEYKGNLKGDYAGAEVSLRGAGGVSELHMLKIYESVSHQKYINDRFNAERCADLRK